ncbi:MAG: outer membrane lipoprotein carrier protein LolA [Deltaproteobacteria bacterium RIFOXYD12_FULL_55_16]|nr:MAG: outer membrane lipoprotein carrier protein LolA [Deltaproteobacteria bacterium RIFOXYD12_FULL_55_16]
MSRMDFNLKPLFSLLLALTFLAVLPASGHGAALTPLELAQKLQARYEETKTMTADFKQSTSVPMTSRKRLGAGKLVISKPGRIRWDYQTPERQVLISNGKKVSMYVASSAQMVVQPVAQYINSDVTYAFFVGTGNIVRDFKVLPPERQEEAGLKAIKLVPKTAHPQVDYLHVWIDENFMIRRLEIVDNFGSITNISLANIKRNEPVSPEVFTFTPPLGTEIIEQ